MDGLSSLLPDLPAGRGALLLLFGVFDALLHAAGMLGMMIPLAGEGEE